MRVMAATAAAGKTPVEGGASTQGVALLLGGRAEGGAPSWPERPRNLPMKT